MPSTAFELSLASRLAAVFGHQKIYPNTIPLNTNPAGDDEDDETCTVDVPAVAYRLISERGTQCFSGTHGPYVANFLIEMFAASADDTFTARETLKSAFQGPVDPKNPGGWVRWIKGGPVIRWATFSDPSSGDDFPMTDAHDIVNFSRGVIEVLYE